MKNYPYLSLFLALAIFEAGYAADNSKNKSKNNPSHIYVFEEEYEIPYVPIDGEIYPPSFSPNKPFRVMLQGEFVVWHLTSSNNFGNNNESQVTYTVTSQPNNNGTQKTTNLDYEWAPGARAYLGFYFKNRWDLRAAYTYIHNDGSLSVSGQNLNINGTPGFSSQPLNPPNPGISLDFTKEHWKGTWQELTFTLGKLLYLGQKVGIHPYIGIDSGWAKESTNSYFSGQQSGGGGISSYNTNYDQHLTAWWVGPHFGFDLSYAFARGFSFYSNAAISAVYGQSNTSRNEFNNFNTFIFQNTTEEDTGMNVALYAQIGLSYLYLINNKQALTFSLGSDFFTVPTFNGIGGNVSVRWDF